jgi:hypothetical protein
MGRRRGCEEGEGVKKERVGRRRGCEQGEGGKTKWVEEGMADGGIYKERASKDRGKEKGNEEMKGRWSACGIGEFENGKSGKKKRGKERNVAED